MIWIQVRDVHAGHARLAAAGVPVVRKPAAEPWGLTEMWIEDPDGVRIVLVEVPAGHPLRRDPRSLGRPGPLGALIIATAKRQVINAGEDPSACRPKDPRRRQVRPRTGCCGSPTTCTNTAAAIRVVTCGAAPAFGSLVWHGARTLACVP